MLMFESFPRVFQDIIVKKNASSFPESLPKQILWEVRWLT